MIKSERGNVSMSGSGVEVLADIMVTIVAFINAGSEGETKEEKLRQLDGVMKLVRENVEEIGFEPDEVRNA